MNAAKNMDSVFSACTENELEFDAMFDDKDDTIIDVVAGVDEAGNPLTGEDFDWDAFDALGEADDMVGENPDFDYPNDEVGSDFEDSKERKMEIGGEVGDGKEVSGKENSAESQAHDDTKEVDDAIGVNDKQQTALEASDLIDLIEASEDADTNVGGPNPDGEMGTMDSIEGTEAEKLVCPACGKNPCECKASNENALLDTLCDFLFESEDPIADDIDDAEAREGKADPVDDTEGVDQTPVGAALEAFDLIDLIEATEEEDEEDDAPDTDAEEGCCKEDAAEGPLEDDDVAEREGETSDLAVETESYELDADILKLLESEDPIADDIDDAEAREGKADPVDDTEGVDQTPVGAALEANDFLDDLIDEADPDKAVIDMDFDYILGDEVVQDLEDDADIKVAKEAAEDDVEDALSDDQEDDAIESIDAESDDTEGDTDIESGYDDDELIDAIINGDVEDL